MSNRNFLKGLTGHKLSARAAHPRAFTPLETALPKARLRPPWGDLPLMRFTPLETALPKARLRPPWGDLPLTGFTLVELMAVITIIMFMMGMLTVTTQKIRKRAQIDKARTTITQLEMALSMYQADWGFYPPTAEGWGGDGGRVGAQHNGNSSANLGWNAAIPVNSERWNNLVAALTTTQRNGPYIEFKQQDLWYDPDPTHYQSGSSPTNPSPYDLRWCRVLLDPWDNAYIYTSRLYYDVPYLAQWAVVGDEYHDDVPRPVDGIISSNNPKDEQNWGPFHPNCDLNAGVSSNYDTLLQNNTYNIYSLGPSKSTFDGDADGTADSFSASIVFLETTWDVSALYDDFEDGDPYVEEGVGPAEDLSNNDDICSW